MEARVTTYLLHRGKTWRAYLWINNLPMAIGRGNSKAEALSNLEHKWQEYTDNGIRSIHDAMLIATEENDK